MFNPNTDLKNIMKIEDELVYAAGHIDNILRMDLLDSHARHALTQVQNMMNCIDRAITLERLVIMNTIEFAKDDYKDLLKRAEEQRQARLKSIKEHPELKDQVSISN